MSAMITSKLKKTGIIFFFIFCIISVLSGYESGIKINNNFWMFFKEILVMMPFIFILIGLFEVWVKKETIENHLGEKSKRWYEGYLWAFLLSSLNIGGMLLAFPVAYSIYKKNARLSVVLTYLCASGLLRINMIIFEISFVGLKFTLIRVFTAIPLIILFSVLIEKNFKNYKLAVVK
ncbi:permease [Candidatus Dependentiae bacterium]|nr:permease [Candidatus Dependentiae bacterium]